MTPHTTRSLWQGRGAIQRPLMLVNAHLSWGNLKGQGVYPPSHGELCMGQNLNLGC